MWIPLYGDIELSHHNGTTKNLNLKRKSDDLLLKVGNIFFLTLLVLPILGCFFRFPGHFYMLFDTMDDDY